MKRIIWIMGILLVGFALNPGARVQAGDPALDEFILDIGDSLPPGDSGEINNSWLEKIFQKLKDLAVRLANRLGVAWESLRNDVLSIIGYFQSARDDSRVQASYDREGNSASLHFMTKFDKPLADELGVEENYELAEVKLILNNKKTEKKGPTKISLD